MVIMTVTQGIPSGSVTQVLDFVSSMFVALITTLTVPFLRVAFNALSFILFTLAPALAFSLVVMIFLFMFNRKYIGMKA